MTAITATIQNTATTRPATMWKTSTADGDQTSAATALRMIGGRERLGSI